MEQLLLNIPEKKLFHLNFTKKNNVVEFNDVKYEKKYNDIKMFDFLTLQILKSGEIIIKGLKKTTLELIKFFYNKKNIEKNDESNYIEFTLFEKTKKIINGIYLNINTYFKSDKELVLLTKNKLLFDLLRVDRDLLRKNAPDLTQEEIKGFYKSFSLNKNMVFSLLEDLEKISNISEIKISNPDLKVAINY